MTAVVLPEEDACSCGHSHQALHVRGARTFLRSIDSYLVR